MPIDLTYGGYFEILYIENINAMHLSSFRFLFYKKTFFLNGLVIGHSMTISVYNLLHLLYISFMIICLDQLYLIWQNPIIFFIRLCLHNNYVSKNDIAISLNAH